FVIENRPGGGNNIGTEAVVRAPADGYTLLMAATPNAVNATLYDKLSFNFLRDIAPVAGIIRAPYVMAVNPTVAAKTIPELIAYAKANPGKLSMGSTGTGSGAHMAGEPFKMIAGPPSPSPPPPPPPHCRTSRRSANSCRDTRRAPGPVSARPRTPRRRSSTGSTRRSTGASPIPKSRGG